MSAKIKRALSLILSLVMIFGVFSAAGEGIGFSGIMNVTASAGEILPYSINNNKVTITNPNYYIDENGDAVIPERIERLPVTAIRGGFSNPILKTVYIPKSVTSIENYIYVSNPLSFESIIDGLTHIYRYSLFGNCPNLETITIAEDNPVYHSSGKCIIETESKTLVSGCASSVIPDDGSVTSIGDFAFSGVKGLKNIYIPSSIERIGVSPFNLGDYDYSNICSDVESITVSENNPHYHSAGNCLIETETGRLVSGCKNSVIPDDGSVTAIGDYAFSQVDSLESVVIIPDSVSLIGEGAFLYSIDLESVFIPNSVTAIGSFAFADCTRIQSISIPDSVTDIGYAAFAECDNLISISFGSGLRNIESMKMTQLAGGGYSFNDLFNSSTKLESITVSPDNPVFHSSGNCLIETDTKTLIAGCKASVIPDDGSVLTIGVGAFINCEELRSVAIPDSVTVIDGFAFSGCSNLESISFGNGLTHIKDNNFTIYTINENYLSNVSYNGSREEWETVIIDDYNFALNYANIHFNDGTMSFADYTALDALIATIPEDLSVYTEDSVTVLNEVLGSIVRDLPAEEQATVDGYAESLSAAIDGLYFEPVASISSTQVIRGERATWTVTTPLNVMWLRFTCNYTTAGGASGKTVLSLKYGNTYSGSTEFSVKEENGMRIWTVSMPFTYPGTSASATQNWKVEYKRRGSSVWETARILSGTKWKAKAGIKEYSQEVLVGKTAEALMPATPGYEKFTLLGSIADKEAGTFTVVTTDDVSKIRISYTDANTGKTKSYAYQTTSSSVISRENQDGLTVWVVKYKFNAPAENDIYTVSVRGPAWGEGKTATVW